MPFLVVVLPLSSGCYVNGLDLLYSECLFHIKHNSITNVITNTITIIMINTITIIITISITMMNIITMMMIIVECIINCY